MKKFNLLYKGKNINLVPVVFCILSLVGVYLSGMSTSFVLNQVITRFIRDGVMVLALIIPIAVGMGINFAITIGAISGQAALLAGGATIKKAKVRNVFIGIVLFHTLFIVSPQAGQNVFSNAALGEYFRSFVAYGTIAFALIMNIKGEKQNI
jgi:hypothetical protein